MEILVGILAVAAYAILRLVLWIAHRIKYPILSDTPPMGILSRGNKVFFAGDDREWVFHGLNDRNEIAYVFSNGMHEHHLSLFQVLRNLKCVKTGRTVKWRRTTKDKRYNFLEKFNPKDTIQIEQ